MKFFSLSGEANRPCSVISFKDTTLMLDCCLDQTPLQHFLPLQLVPNQRLNNMNYWQPREADTHLEGELRECTNRVFVDSPPEFKTPTPHLVNFSELDAVLVSNYLNILALPYITCGTGFRGVVLMTEPTLQFGRLLMKELVEYIERCPKARSFTNWKQFLRHLPPPLRDVKVPQAWLQIYNTEQMTEALSYVNVVAYNEPVNICGAVKVTAVCSGASVGGCNWDITSHQHKIVYLSTCSSLTNHPRPINFKPLKNPDVLIISSLVQRPISNPDHMMNEFCSSVLLAIRNNGNALIPSYPSGLVYDMIECLVGQLDSVNLTQVPIYFISSVAKQSLAYSNIFGEWLTSSKQNKVLLPEEPFVHSNLVRNGRLKVFKSLHADGFSSDFKQPCIVFCGHPSLRFGDAVHFMELWGSNPMNVVIFTEPEFDLQDSLSPFQPLAMRHVYCPIDTALNYTQTHKLVSELKPKRILLPEKYTKPGFQAPMRPDHILDLSSLCPHPPDMYSLHTILSIPLIRTAEPASVTPELAASLSPVTVRPGGSSTSGSVTVATVSAELCHQDNVFTLKLLDEEAERKGRARDLIPSYPQKYPYGLLQVERLLQGLSQAGMVDARLEEDASGCIITIDSEDAIIQIRDNSTHIITSIPKTRKNIRDILLKCLQQI